MAQVIIGGSLGTVAASTTAYTPFMGSVASTVSADTLARQIIPTNGKITSLAFRPNLTPTQNATITLIVNGQPTALTCTTNSASIAHDSTNSVQVYAGDTVSMQIVVAAGATARFYSHSMIFTPNSPGESIICGNSNTASISANQFWGIANPSLPNLNESQVRLSVPESGGIFKKLYVQVVDSPTGTTSQTFTFFNNGIAGNNTVTISSGSTTGNDLTHTDTITNTGNTASLKITATGSPNFSNTAWGIVYVSPTPGNFIIMSTTINNTLSNAGNRFLPLGGAKGVATNETNESYVSNAFTAKRIYSRLGTAAGASNGWDFSLRQNLSTTALVVNISGATQLTGFTNTDVSITLDDRLDFMQAVNTGTPTIGTWRVSLVGYLADTTNPNFFQFFD